MTHDHDAAAVTYVIAMTDRQMGIGPFGTRADAQSYLEKSGTDMAVLILSLVGPVDPPSDDADLNP